MLFSSIGDERAPLEIRCVIDLERIRFTSFVVVVVLVLIVLIFVTIDVTLARSESNNEQDTLSELVPVSTVMTVVLELVVHVAGGLANLD